MICNNTLTQKRENNVATITENQGDASANSGTRYTLSVGDTFQGSLDRLNDVDWIRVELSADINYDIVLNGEFSLGFDIFDSAGNHFASDIQSNSGPKLTGSPDVSGTYYIAVKGRDSGYAGDYELSLEEHLITTGSYDEIADYLVNGAWEWYGEPGFAFDVEPGGAITADITALTQTGQQLARLALEAWTSVTGIRFEFVDDDNALITFDDDEEGASADFTRSGGAVISSMVNVSTDIVEQSPTGIGSHSLFVYMHEIGHALGLGHSGPYDAVAEYGTHNIFLIDSWQATILSYFTQADNTHINASHATPVTPMIADIIAIQNLYGAPTDTRTGDTVYGYQSNVDGYLGEFFRLWVSEENPFAAVSVADPSGKLSLIDLDGDGDVDVVMGDVEGAFHYFENTGSATEPEFSRRTDTDNPLNGLFASHQSAPEFADLDADGDYDLVAGSLLGEISYFENTGAATAPVFTQLTGAANPLDGVTVGGHSIPELADFDGDGDLDLVVGSQDSALAYFENTGTQAGPVFTQRTGEANPFNGINSDPGYNSGPVLSDLDGDGDLDLIFWNWYDTHDYFENTGTAGAPVFTARTGEANLLKFTEYNGFRMPEFADLDNDNDLDIVFGVHEGAVQYVKNSGTPADPEFAAQTLGPVALTLYDNGGNDTLDLRTDSADQRVDLRPEGISDVYGLVGNLVIARDTMIENFIAGHGNDQVVGNAVANRLEGRDGDDVLKGGEGDDLLIGGPGSDMVEGNSGKDTASYEDSDTGVTVRLHSLAATGGAAEGDTFGSLVSVGYTDTDGATQTEMLPDIENLTGSAHNDTLAGDRRANEIDGGAGDDTLYGGPGGGDDVMRGGPGRDTLYGGAGDDRLVGGAGNDRLIGGPGADVFVFAPGDGEDMVTDFGRDVDRIDLTAFDLESMDDLTITSGADGVTIDLTAHAGGTILLAGFELADLDATDFLF